MTRRASTESSRQFIAEYLRAVVGHVKEAGLLRVTLRAIIVWILDVFALWLVVGWMPGIHASSLGTLMAAALTVGLLNALVRPVILAFAVNLGLAPFALFLFVLNGIVLYLAGVFISGFEVVFFWTAPAASFVLTALTTILMGLLHIDDDDSFYRNVTAHFLRRASPVENPEKRGMIIIQIDGLAAPILTRALAEKRMPTLQSWIDNGSHRLVEWECDIPSMTSSSQAGILWGNNANIPAFRWFDKEKQRLIVSNHPADALWLDGQQRTDWGLLSGGNGSSIGNIFTGGASSSIMTMATVVDESGNVAAASRDFAGFVSNPYNLTRLFLHVFAEIGRETVESTIQRMKRVQPRMHRGFKFAIQRSGTNVFLEQMAVWFVVSDIERARMATYVDMLGYDEVAHHAGPGTADALRCLKKIDYHLREISRAAGAARRPYDIVVLSDHGQSNGATFRQRYGTTLEGVVQDFIGAGVRVEKTEAAGEAAGYMGATLTEMAAEGGMAGRAAGQATSSGMLTQDSRDKASTEAADVVVCASGNLGLISFARVPGRMTAEGINDLHPGLVEALVQHPGIAWALVASDSRGPLVVGRDGVRMLATGNVDGVDPLGGFPRSSAKYLTRMASFPNTPDIVVNSTLYNAETGEVAAFEELIGCHGGAGGFQTRPFICFPASWTEGDPRLEGAESVHRFLREHQAHD